MSKEQMNVTSKINWQTVRDTALSFLTITGYQIYTIRRENDLRDKQREKEVELRDKQREKETELRERALKAELALEHKQQLEEIRRERTKWWWQ